MSSPPSPRPRPDRPHRPSFFLDNADDEDDFFQGTSRAHPVSPDDLAPEDPNAALLPASRPLSTSDVSNVFADPASASTSAQSHSHGHSQSSADYYRQPGAARNSYPPAPHHGIMSPQPAPMGAPIGAPGTGPFQFRYKPAPAPPSAFVDRRADSPASASNGPWSSEDGHLLNTNGANTPSPPAGYPIAPAPPFARPSMHGGALSEASRTSSAHSFAPPPLPWLRDSSRSSMGGATTPTGGTEYNPGKLTPRRKAFTSHLLKGTVPKPWLQRRDKWATASQWITRLLFVLGVGAAAVLCFFGYSSLERLTDVCLLMEDNFDSLDTNTWQREVELGGLNGEFQWYTASDNNSFVDSGKLYIVPTLTSDVIGEQAVFNGYKLNLGDCTTSNKTMCNAVSSNGASTVINPVQSARLTTRQSYNLKYGRVEVRAKMPQGDWLWPAIWMLPVNNSYGAWPMSGEIDIAEARGNPMTYPAQGSNFVSSAMHWGPTTTIDAWTHTWGWATQRRSSYADGFHTYAIEWTDQFMRFYVDSRVTTTLDISFKKKSLFDLGKFPSIIQNGSQEVVLPNPWEGRGNNAPFDQPFYLILNVAVGGTNGWFPDDVDNKPWVDQSATAMRDFAFHQNDWFSTWPQDTRQRAMVVDSVKMYSKC